MFKEFREFIMRGNVIDLAVAVIIGVAFKSIITSLVSNIIMPVLGMFIGENFNNLLFEINGVSIMYGNFIQAVIEFVIIAFVIFMMIKLINQFQKKKEEAQTEPPAPTKDQELLTEIRDLLKDN